MPRYFFNVYEQVGMIDTVGIELADTRAARKEAIRYAGSMLADGAFVNELDLDWRMEVTNSSGLILFRLDFLLTIAPAATEMKFELASTMSP